MKRKVRIVDPATRAAWSKLWGDMHDGVKSDSAAPTVVPGPAEPDIDAVLGEPAEEGEE